KPMLTTLKTLLIIRTSTLTNGFIYYIQKLPLIGKQVSDRAYGNISLKTAVSVIALILSILWGFFLRFAYVGLVIYLPVIALGTSLSTADQAQHFVHIFVLLSFIVAGVSSATILEPKREKYVATKLMRLPSRDYMLSTLTYRYATFLIYLLPAMIVFGSLLEISILHTVLLAVSVTLWRIVTEVLHLELYLRTNL